MKELTERQHTVLWMYAQGLTTESIGRRMVPPVSANAVRKVLIHCIEKLDGRTTTHTVFLAATTGVIGPYLDCGKEKAAYDRHLRQHEPVCIACRYANTKRVMGHLPMQRTVRPKRALEITPAHVRVLRAMRDGAHSGNQIAAALGIGPGIARRHVRAIMDRLEIDDSLVGRDVAFKNAVAKAIEERYIDPA